MATGGALAALALVFAAWDPLAAPGPVLCLFRRTTGIACPGCGLTRATALLFQGQLSASLALHPGATLLTLDSGLAWLLWGEGLFVGRLRSRSAIAAMVALTAGLLLVLWLVRWASGALPS